MCTHEQIDVMINWAHDIKLQILLAYKMVYDYILSSSNNEVFAINLGKQTLGRNTIHALISERRDFLNIGLKLECTHQIAYSIFQWIFY